MTQQYLSKIKREARAMLPNQYAPFADNGKLFKKKVLFYVHGVKRILTRQGSTIWMLHIRTITPGQYTKPPKDEPDYVAGDSDDYTLTFGSLEYRDLVLVGLAEVMGIDLSAKDSDDVLEPYGPCKLKKVGRMFDLVDVKPSDDDDDEVEEEEEEDDDDDDDEHPFN